MKADHNMKFYFAQECDEDLYFSSAEYNGLFKKNKECNYVEYLGAFEEEDLLQAGLHSRVYKDGNKLFFLPYNGTGITVYDLGAKKMEFKKMSSNVHYASYVSAYKIEDSWLLIPQKNDWKFLWLDVEHMCIREDDKLFELVKEKVGKFEIDLWASFIADEKIYISFYGTSFIGILDIKKNEINWKMFEGYQLQNIVKSGEDIWVSTLNGKVIKWNEAIDIERVYEFDTSKNRPFYYVLSWNNRLFLLPFSTDEIYEYDHSSDDWHSLVSVMPSEYQREIYEETPLIVGYTKKTDCLELYPRSANGILVITDNSVEYKTIKSDSKICDIVKQYPQKIISKRLKSESIVEESSQLRLEDFLGLLNGK